MLPGTSPPSGRPSRDRLRAGAAQARDVAEAVRAVGPRAAGRDLGRRIARRLVERHDDMVILRDLGMEPFDAAAAPPVRIEHAAPRHLATLAAFERRRANTRALRRHLHMGGSRDGMLGFTGDELIGYVWWMDRARALHHVDVIRLELPMEEGDVYGLEMFVEPGHRGGGASTQFLDAACAELARLGFARMWGCVDRRNTPARWLYAISGFEDVR